MATAFTTYTDGEVVAKSSGGNYAGSPAFTVLTGFYDATRRNMTVDTDTMALINLPAGTLVHNVVLEVLTIEATTTPVISVGDATDPNGWVASESTAVVGKFLGAGAYAIATGTSKTNGKLYTAATTLNLEQTTTDSTTLKCKVHVICTIM